MIESKPTTLFEISSKISTETGQLISETIKQAGYHRENIVLNANDEPSIHFKKPFTENRAYPHFHLIVDFNGQAIEPALHLDVRKHRSIHKSSDVSLEFERLYQVFSQESLKIAAGGKQQEVKKFTDKLLILALFGISDYAKSFSKHSQEKHWLQKTGKKRRRKIKRGIAKQIYIRRKYQADGDLEIE